MPDRARRDAPTVQYQTTRPRDADVRYEKAFCKACGPEWADAEPRFSVSSATFLRYDKDAAVMNAEQYNSMSSRSVRLLMQMVGVLGLTLDAKAVFQQTLKAGQR